MSEDFIKKDRGDNDGFVHYFIIEQLVPVEPELVRAAEEAVALLYDRMVKRAGRFHIVFNDHAVRADGKTGEVLKTGEAYEPDTKIIYIFTGSSMFQKIVSEVFRGDLKAVVTLLAAHAAVHQWQHERGDQMVPQLDLDLETYLNLRTEVEAWEQSLHILKFFYPGARGVVRFGENGVTVKEFAVPNTSRYI